MAKIEVKDPEQLGTLLTEMKDVGDKTAEKVKVFEELKIDEVLKGFKEAQEKAKQENEQLLEKVKSLTLAVKARGSWKDQDTPIAKQYGMGKIVQAVAEARKRKPGGVATKTLIEMGAKPVKPMPGGWEEEEKVILGEDLKEKAGLSSTYLTGDDSAGSYYGSYTIPVEYRSEVLRIALDTSAMMGLVYSFPVPAITSYTPLTTDELAFTKVSDQSTDKTEDTLTFGRATLTTEIYAAYLTIVEEFFEDTLVDVGRLVLDMFAEAWGKKFDNLCLADGTYGALTLCTLSSVMAAGDASFDGLTPEYLHDLIKDLTTRAKRMGAMFFMHVTIWDKIRTAKNADGDYYFGPITGGMEQRAWGYPVVLSDAMPDADDSAASTSFVLFGNPKRILNGQRVGFEFKIFDQTQSAMEAGQVFLRCRIREAFTLGLTASFTKLTTAAS